MDLNTSEVIEGAAAAGSIDELLADLDLSGLAGTETVEEVIESMTADDLEAVEQHSAIEEAYSEQETSATEVSAPEVSEPAAATEKRARKPRAAKAAKAPAAPKDLSSIDPAVFVLEDGVTDLDANKAAVLAKVPTQKKIAEKFENVFRAVSVNKRPSVYVMATFDVLNDKGEATSGDLVGVLKAAGYNEGTARSQAGQVMVLFNLLGVATREGQKLTLNRDAPMTKRLAALPAPAAS